MIDLTKTILLRFFEFVDKHLLIISAMFFAYMFRNNISKILDHLPSILDRLKQFSYKRQGTMISADLDPKKDDDSLKNITEKPETLKENNIDSDYDGTKKLNKIIFDAKNLKEAREIYHNEKTQYSFHTKTFNLYYLYTFYNDKDALRDLEELFHSELNEVEIVDCAEFLSKCYLYSDNYVKNEELWQNTLNIIKNDHNITLCLCRISEIHNLKGELEKSDEIINDLLVKVTTSKEKLCLYRTITKVNKKRENSEIAAMAMEKIIELDLNNKDDFFDTAYLEDNAQLNLLSFYNYQKSLQLDHSNAGALNNLGVKVGEFELKAKKNSFYKNAVSKNNTLAMANLAYSYLDAGFLEEAKTILDKAKKREDCHSSVFKAICRLNNIKEKEDEQWAGLLKKAELFQKNFREYVTSYFERKIDASIFESEWYTEKGEKINIEINENSFHASWKEKLTSYLLPSPIMKLDNFNTIEIEGTCYNGTAKVVYLKNRDPQQTFLSDRQSIRLQYYSYLTLDTKKWIFFSGETEKEFSLLREIPVSKK